MKFTATTDYNCEPILHNDIFVIKKTAFYFNRQSLNNIFYKHYFFPIKGDEFALDGRTKLALVGGKLCTCLINVKEPSNILKQIELKPSKKWAVSNYEWETLSTDGIYLQTVFILSLFFTYINTFLNELFFVFA